MITVQESAKSMFVDMSKRTILCPFCKKEMSFYSTSPDRCSGCGKNLLNFITIVNSKVYRANYHFGFIDTTGTMIMSM